MRTVERRSDGGARAGEGVGVATARAEMAIGKVEKEEKGGRREEGGEEVRYTSVLSHPPRPCGSEREREREMERERERERARKRE